MLTGVNWFSIKLQNVIIKRIHFIKCGGKPLVRGGYNQMYFYLQVDGPTTGGKAYEQQFVQLF